MILPGASAMAMAMGINVSHKSVVFRLLFPLCESVQPSCRVGKASSY